MSGINLSIEFDGIVDYCGGTNRRLFTEGMAVYNAKHIISCGFKAENTDCKVCVIALCLQSSHPKQKPHEIKLIFENDLSKFNETSCSCIAGVFKCKHVAGTLLFVYQ